MAYFDQVERVVPDQSEFQLLLQRVERRAMEVACEHQSPVSVFTGDNPIIIDPYGEYSPQDTDLWMDIFIKAYENREFYARLFYLRGAGTVLVANQRWGYVFRPVIGPQGWSSQNEYNREKQCLNEYRDEVIKLLEEIKR